MAQSPHDINTTFITSRKIGLSSFHLNIRSARHKEDELSILLNEFAFDFDVIMLTETWYSSDTEVYRRDGYNSFFLNRPNKQGGGIEILIKNNLECEIIPELSLLTEDFECLCLKSRKYIYCVIYRPPNGQFNQFISHIELLFNYVNVNNLE